MKFSMNGFRRQLSGDVANLREVLLAVLRDDYYEKEELINAMNTIITHSNVLNCVYQPGDQTFTDMGDIEVEHLTIDAEGIH